MFVYINNYWNETAKYIPEWWREMKEANGYQKDIDDHEGMTKVQTYKWIKKS